MRGLAKCVFDANCVNMLMAQVSSVLLGSCACKSVRNQAIKSDFEVNDRKDEV